MHSTLKGRGPIRLDTHPVPVKIPSIHRPTPFSPNCCSTQRISLSLLLHLLLFLLLLLLLLATIYHSISSYDKCHVADVNLTELALEKGSPLLVKSSSNPMDRTLPVVLTQGSHPSRRSEHWVGLVHPVSLATIPR